MSGYGHRRNYGSGYGSSSMRQSVNRGLDGLGSRFDRMAAQLNRGVHRVEDRYSNIRGPNSSYGTQSRNNRGPESRFHEPRVHAYGQGLGDRYQRAVVNPVLERERMQYSRTGSGSRYQSGRTSSYSNPCLERERMPYSRTGSGSRYQSGRAQSSSNPVYERERMPYASAGNGTRYDSERPPAQPFRERSRQPWTGTASGRDFGDRGRIAYGGGDLTRERAGRRGERHVSFWVPENPVMNRSRMRY